MNYQDIRAQLDTAVAGITGLPTIHNENKLSKPVAGTPFTRTTLLPARPNQLTIGQNGTDELIGLYQVDLYYPLGSGATAAASLGDSVVNTFPRTWQATVGGQVLRVTQCWLEPGREINNWYVVSAVLSWATIR